MNNSGIYLILNKINGKGYVGLSKNIKKRWKKHISQLEKNHHGNKYLQNAWNKYGKKNFDFLILENCDEKKLFIAEEWWITFLNTYKNGYNLTLGGKKNCGFYPNTETRKKMSEAMKKRMTPEYKKFLSSVNKGKKQSEETKAKKSNALKGKSLSQENKEKKSFITTQTGIFRLSIKNPDKYHQEKRFRYNYYEKNKRKTILRKTIQEIYDFVKENNLEWIILDKNKAVKYLSQIQE